MDKESASKILTKAKFHFAKTMSNIPHSYTRKREWSDSDLFEEVVMFIRENGVRERFYSKTYTYFYDGDYKYWTMGSPINETILINRAKA